MGEVGRHGPFPSQTFCLAGNTVLCPVLYPFVCALQKCPFEAIMIINLPKDLEKETTHRYGPNTFKLHRCGSRLKV